jgi:hypothetical protein
MSHEATLSLPLLALPHTVGFLKCLESITREVPAGTAVLHLLELGVYSYGSALLDCQQFQHASSHSPPAVSLMSVLCVYLARHMFCHTATHCMMVMMN